MKEAEYDKLKQRITQEYREKLRALDMIWDMSQEGSPEESKRKADSTYGRTDEIVKSAAVSIGKEFTAKEIAKVIEAANPGTEIAKGPILRSLKKLAQQGSVKLVRAGEGRAPATYQPN